MVEEVGTDDGTDADLKGALRHRRAQIQNWK